MTLLKQNPSIAVNYLANAMNVIYFLEVFTLNLWPPSHTSQSTYSFMTFSYFKVRRCLFSYYVSFSSASCILIFFFFQEKKNPKTQTSWRNTSCKGRVSSGVSVTLRLVFINIAFAFCPIPKWLHPCQVLWTAKYLWNSS